MPATRELQDEIIRLKKENDISKEAVLSIGFVPVEDGESTVTYRYRKPVMGLKKV